jgi:hypothetical protein
MFKRTSSKGSPSDQLVFGHDQTTYATQLAGTFTIFDRTNSAEVSTFKNDELYSHMMVLVLALGQVAAMLRVCADKQQYEQGQFGGLRVFSSDE